MATPKIIIGSDHAGFALKESLKAFLLKEGFDVTDVGTYSSDSTDYADYAHAAAQGVAEGDFPFGLLVCGSGQGVCITANKHKGVRAALVWEEEIASLARKHNDANILCLPARFIAEETAQQCLTTFLNTAFEGGRHQARVAKIEP